jgi:hypothetical protein
MAPVAEPRALLVQAQLLGVVRRSASAAALLLTAPRDGRFLALRHPEKPKFKLLTKNKSNWLLKRMLNSQYPYS